MAVFTYLIKKLQLPYGKGGSGSSNSSDPACTKYTNVFQND